MKKYQDLESKIVELQKEVDRLKKEEEKQNKLPKDINRDACIRFVETFGSSDLKKSFAWKDTPQGAEYWVEIFNNIHYKLDSYEVPKEAIIYIQGIVIKSYQQENSK
jgi:hypothetical protein